MEATISKNYSSYKLHPKAFKLFLNFLPNGSHKTAFGIFENWNFNDFFLFSLTWDPVGVKNSSYKSQPKAFKLFLNFLPNGPHKTVFGIFEILSFWFVTNFFQKFKIHYWTLSCCGETKNLNYLENERSYSKTEWNLWLGSTLGYWMQLLELWPIAKFHAQIWQF